ncbi:MAG TPA: amidohydrolase family protein, partial [Tetrasphaera australiensis]|nr:amidohydrolase family protein [Tetrasphaera australiensis]
MTADSTTAGGGGQVLTAATVLTPDAVLSPGWVRVEGDRITEVGDGLPPGPTGSAGRDEWVATDLGAATLAPGFVDVHSHGGGGAAYTDGVEAAGIARAAHLAHGATSTMASLVTDTVDRLVDQVRALAPLVACDDLLGVHLEGPWLAERYKGAHDPGLLRAPSPEDVDRLIAAGPVAMVTLAPELPGASEAVRRFVEAGVLVAIGHSDA